MHRYAALWERNDPPAAAWGLLVLAAAAVGVAGYLHGHLFWTGYAQVQVVGPLFWLNALGSGVVVACLFLGRALLFALGALAISLGSVVSIFISHQTSFFGFAEQHFDAQATAIIVAEIAAIGFVVLAALIARSRLVSVAGRELAR